MADTTRLEVDREVAERLTALAAGHHLTSTATSPNWSQSRRTRPASAGASAAFREAVERPGFAEAFARDFGHGSLASRAA
ncbi:antitoxin MazE7 [Streptomyces violascens]|uniref:antitoxin MazE7 n=1 Tax=Streptomyces violascens TaxID=67381 RepID=UPI0036BC5E8C